MWYALPVHEAIYSVSMKLFSLFSCVISVYNNVILLSFLIRFYYLSYFSTLLNLRNCKVPLELEVYIWLLIDLHKVFYHVDALRKEIGR
uniref:Uncharacterized protein n=1 Tax=Arundo donax TaxID=35708 RepID=A0A0A9D2X4_ARUDO